MNQKRTVTAMMGTVVLLAATTGQAQKSPLGQAAYGRAQQHLAASRFQEAAAELETAVRYEPRFAMGWYVLASAQRRAQHCDEAVFAYRRYIELRPADAEPYYGLGLCLHVVGDRDGAIAAFQHYVQGDVRPGSREFVTIARQHLGDLERERAAMVKVAGAGAATSSSSAALTDARKLRERGRTEEAIARYRTAIAGPDKSSADAHAELGALLVSARRTGEAVEVLRAAVRLAPAEAPAWYNLGFALRQSSQPAEAVAAYRRYITFRPKDPDPHYGLARAYAALGRDQEALAAFRVYATLETRLTERQWLKKARLEIARLESKLAPATVDGKAPVAGAAAPRPTREPPAMGSTPTSPAALAPAKMQPGAAPSTAVAAPLPEAPGSAAPAKAAPSRQP